MRVISKPGRASSGPKPPSWSRTFWRRAGTVVEHDGQIWELIWVGAADQEWKQWERIKEAGNS